MIGERRFQTPALLLASVALAGCVHTTASPVAVPAASRSGDVGVTDIMASGGPSGRLVLVENETFFLPLPAADNALPVYPPPLLAQRLPPQAVCLEIGIDAGGNVKTAMPIMQAPDCPADDPGMPAVVDRRFFDAAAHAARQWRFDPAFRCEYPTDLARSRGDCSGGRETPQAVSLAYRFIFEQRGGRGSVRQSAE